MAPRHHQPAAAAGASFERSTRQRGAILEAFSDAARPLSTAEIVENANARGTSVSLATVYRAVRSLVDDGSLVAVGMPGGIYYELAGKDHHHHFACDRCAGVYELEGCFDTAQLRVPRGFRATGHDLVVHGLCRNCRAAENAKT